MPVLAEAYSVIVRVDSMRRVMGRTEPFEELIPNATGCTDGEIYRVGFMGYGDALDFIDTLEDAGLTFLTGDKAVDIAITDQDEGLLCNCDWLYFADVPLREDQKITACKLLAGEKTQVYVPHDWTYECSLYASGKRNDPNDPNLEFLRHDDGCDVYRDKITGQLQYVGRYRQHQSSSVQ